MNSNLRRIRRPNSFFGYVRLGMSRELREEIKWSNIITQELAEMTIVQKLVIAGYV